MGSSGESGGGGGAASVRESHDFANVAAFSELPFLRAAPAREGSTGSGIRLFGIDVPHAPSETKTKETAAGAAASAAAMSSSAMAAAAAPADSSRKFECHYCCRHFPTSQALGGHQNAHKRERQNAKRVQMQSAMAAAAAAASGAHHHNHLLGYPQHRFGVAGPTVATLYPSWPSVHHGGSGATAAGLQLYGGVGSFSQPINGNPLPVGLWRGAHASTGMPAYGDQRRPVAALSVLRGDEPRASLASPSSSSSLLSPQGQFVCEPATSTVEGVSLDLHL